jgi:hypothetical protein
MFDPSRNPRSNCISIVVYIYISTTENIQIIIFWGTLITFYQAMLPYNYVRNLLVNIKKCVHKNSTQ